ncbi:MAG: penicillin-binding transpeptidase domain-containing protein [Opitutaceae bacterium]
MARHNTNLADRSGSLVQSHKNYQPRVIFFYFVILLLLLTLAGGLAYQQLFNRDRHRDTERMQNQRRILVPGPRGNIYDREGRLLVGNRARFAVVLYLDELRSEFRREFIRVRKNYRETGDKDLPNSAQLEQIARTSVVQRYLDQVNDILHRAARVDRSDLMKHFQRQLLLPYTLFDDLEPADYARLVENLPVRSPLQVLASSTRYYPYGSAAAHTLGYVGVDSDIDAEDFPGEDLRTFKMKGTVGRDGLEKVFDTQLQGEAGGTIFRVDPTGYKINPPLEKRLPVQGKNLITSLDIDLQRVAEEAIGDRVGTAVALDIRTGEVLVLANKPDYNLSETSPHISPETWQSILDRNALLNQAIGGAYPPGSTFKILTAIAGLRSGKITPDQSIVDCDGVIKIGNRLFYCENGNGHHHDIHLSDAISESCDIYFYEVGRLVTPDVLAAEGRRFHVDQRTGIELPNETTRMLIPTMEWKEKQTGERWFPGDTANMSIGQGYVLVTPLDMACFYASVARDEVYTKPTLLHHPNAPAQHSEAIGLTPAQRDAIIKGMIGTTVFGTAKEINNLPLYHVPVSIAGKTGTAQKRVLKDGQVGTINFAWFACFAPAENPEIAVVVMLEGDTIGETYGGGREAAPVANLILKKYFEKRDHPSAFVQPLKTP